MCRRACVCGRAAILWASRVFVFVCAHDVCLWPCVGPLVAQELADFCQALAYHVVAVATDHTRYLWSLVPSRALNPRKPRARASTVVLGSGMVVIFCAPLALEARRVPVCSMGSGAFVLAFGRPGHAFVQLLTVVQEENKFPYGRVECPVAAMRH